MPTGKTGAERPRIPEGEHSPWKEAARGKGRDKAVPHRNGVRGKGLLSEGSGLAEKGAQDPRTGAPELPR